MKTLVESAERYLEEDKSSIENDLEYDIKRMKLMGSDDKANEEFETKLQAFIGGVEYALEIVQGKVKVNRNRGR